MSSSPASQRPRWPPALRPQQTCSCGCASDIRSRTSGPATCRASRPPCGTCTARGTGCRAVADGGRVITDRGDDLKATSEAIVADAERLRAIEARKETLPEGDPELVMLSEEAEAIARRLVPKTVAERELTTEVANGSS